MAEPHLPDLLVQDHVLRRQKRPEAPGVLQRATAVSRPAIEPISVATCSVQLRQNCAGTMRARSYSTIIAGGSCAGWLGSMPVARTLGSMEVCASSTAAPNTLHGQKPGPSAIDDGGGWRWVAVAVAVAVAVVVVVVAASVDPNRFSAIATCGPNSLCKALSMSHRVDSRSTGSVEFGLARLLW